MRVRVATSILGITAALFAVPACSTDTVGTTSNSAPSARTEKQADTAQQAPLLSSVVLATRLLNESDLGKGYLRKPERPDQHDDASVIGCPALSKLGGDAAIGGTLSFPRKAKAAFTYGGSASEVSEELYSDSADKLSHAIGQIFDAMTGCPTYQVIAGGTPINMASQKLPAPRGLGDEQWSQLLTFSTGGRSMVVKQTAIREGSLLLIVSGSPALVDRHLDKALDKVTAAS
ncbi:hypothetical protein [Streptomyces sp. NBC_01022]|uniref:hypothetical protein n=1 Tax=Streptomyces sp. NBC_01022 TaxID=2903723 RepID=UPI002DD94FF8|nr:hypothetical protein [Streptomyces sp. NBC_01022]WRZ79512.1 hypothetical protein OG316_04145 [Streptomyces sp. NBC_01022]WRZ86163.1 hypothetical protein OG316_40745 [Streptomyces sp. NBC_01022]